MIKLGWEYPSSLTSEVLRGHQAVGLCSAGNSKLQFPTGRGNVWGWSQGQDLHRGCPRFPRTRHGLRGRLPCSVLQTPSAAKLQTRPKPQAHRTLLRFSNCNTIKKIVIWRNFETQTGQPDYLGLGSHLQSSGFYMQAFGI